MMWSWVVESDANSDIFSSLSETLINVIETEKHDEKSLSHKQS